MPCYFALVRTSAMTVSGKKPLGYLNWLNRTMKSFHSFHRVGGCTNTNSFNIELEGVKEKGAFALFFGRGLFHLK